MLSAVEISDCDTKQHYNEGVCFVVYQPPRNLPWVFPEVLILPNTPERIDGERGRIHTPPPAGYKYATRRLKTIQQFAAMGST